MSALWEKLETGTASDVQAALDNGPEGYVLEEGPHGERLLSAAFRKGSLEVALELTKRLPAERIDEPLHGGNTALMEVVRRQSYAQAEQLLERGASVHARNDRGETVLHVLCTKHVSKMVGMAEKLVSAGCLVDARRNDGCTAALVAAGSRKPAPPGLYDTLERLGANLHARNDAGESALFLAVRSGCLADAQYFHAKLGLHAPHGPAGSLLEAAVQSGDAGMVQWVLHEPLGGMAQVTDAPPAQHGALLVAGAQSGLLDECVRPLVAANAALATEDVPGRGFAVHAALNKGRWNTAQWLLQQQPGLASLVDRSGRSNMFHAVLGGVEEAYAAHVGEPVNPNVSRLDGVTAFMLASAHSLERYEALRKKGGDPTLTANRDQPLAMLVARHGNQVELLARLPRAPSGPNGETPLLFALQAGRLLCAQFLLHECDPQSPLPRVATGSAGGETCLYRAAVGGLPSLFGRLLARGETVDQPRNDGWTPLLAALAAGEWAAAQALIDLGADLHAESIVGVDAIGAAASSGCVRLVQQTFVWLYSSSDSKPGTVEYEAISSEIRRQRLSKVYLDGMSPLLMAVANGHERMVHWIVGELGGDSAPAVRNLLRLEQSAIHLAAQANSLPLVNWLLGDSALEALEAKDPAGLTPYLKAALHNAYDVLRELAARGADTSARSLAGEDALLLASLGGSWWTLRWLLKDGAYSVHTKRLSDGKSPLALASWKNHVACVRELLAQGADVNAADVGGYTPLHEACAVGSFRCALALMDAKADVEAKLKMDSATPLYLAVSGGHTRLAALLLDRKANAHVVVQGNTLEKAARSGSRQNVLELLQRRGLAAVASPRVAASTTPRASGTLLELADAFLERLDPEGEESSALDRLLRLVGGCVQTLANQLEYLGSKSNEQRGKLLKPFLANLEALVRQIASSAAALAKAAQADSLDAKELAAHVGPLRDDLQVVRMLSSIQHHRSGLTTSFSDQPALKALKRLLDKLLLIRPLYHAVEIQIPCHEESSS